ncbi:CPBP family intramembrane metalloprotease [Massilia sp. G4R7]|uniref:CPBP family intramembrane metalloprotease n=1 Tax=Massilia phyllostachyos TaxID=2898585 RepID=A0ABS8Q943_9BURK|nr:type II CAAX endopeptidase family protein [Massilia phyllostachyos]MCD2518282.1 CPBP family intramembrane metalloprotease [Massilia phyllostachyos]
MDNAAISSAMPAATDKGITRFTLVRILLALLAVCVPVGLLLVLTQQIPDKALRAYWPALLAALVSYSGYAFYVRRIEARAPAELGRPFVRELGAGMALGAVLFLAVLGMLAATGMYRFTGTGDWAVLLKSATEMVFVAVVEEILFRGVLFRLPERSLGSWTALAVSGVIFALAHIPNENVTFIAVANTAVAGLLFAAAYLATRRLWLPIGMHFAWNFVSDGLFSLPTSGHPARGLLQGGLTGPEWLTGGAYGLEASLLTFIVMGIATVLLLRRALRAGHILPRP